MQLAYNTYRMAGDDTRPHAAILAALPGAYPSHEPTSQRPVAAGWFIMPAVTPGRPGVTPHVKRRALGRFLRPHGSWAETPALALQHRLLGTYLLVTSPYGGALGPWSQSAQCRGTGSRPAGVVGATSPRIMQPSQNESSACVPLGFLPGLRSAPVA